MRSTNVFSFLIFFFLKTFHTQQMHAVEKCHVLSE